MMRILTMLLLGLMPCAAQRGMRSPAFVSSVTEIAPSGSAPDAPTDLSVVDGGGTWQINFTPPVSGDGYEIRRSTDGGATSVVGEFPFSDPFVIDSGPVPGDTHSYRYEIRTTNAFGQSAWAGPVYTVWTYLTEYYRMEEAAGSSRTAFVDTDGFGSFVEQVGNVTQTTGKNNNAAAFTSAAGRSFKSTSASGDARFSGDFSVACWLYVTALPVMIDTTIIIREAVSDVKLNLTAAGDLTWTSVDGDGVSTTALGSLNAWHLVVCTFTGAGDATPRISVDGSAFDASAGATTVISGDDFLYICPPFGGLLSLNGRLDEAMCFSTALSIADVGVLWNGGTGRFLPP